MSPITAPFVCAGIELTEPAFGYVVDIFSVPTRMLVNGSSFSSIPIFSLPPPCVRIV